MVDEKAIEIGREAIARMKDADEAPYSAALIRAGKWDYVSEVAMAIAGARLALKALSPGSTGETEGWRDIESAGRELKAVLGYQATPGDWEGQMAICWPMGPIDKPVVWIGEGGLMPTHWRPLPAPPSAMLSAAGGR